ncbi:hypothetical protein FQN57_002188 [Myotisia sp. PD_48]|nr:hypothetical protein FQN57_002188 [Myotisia sp. PD_48]
MSLPSTGNIRKPSPNGAKTFYKTSSPFEQKIGYYRGVRHGQHIFVAGTTAVNPHSASSAPQILHPGDAHKQTLAAFLECLQAVEALGGKQGAPAESVVRVRMFVGRHEDCEAVADAFTHLFGGDDNSDVGAVATMLVVQNGFVNPDMMVEVEVDAMVDA